MRIFGRLVHSRPIPRTRFVASTTGKLAIAVLVTAAITVPTSVWAVTTFTDVPLSQPFYREIKAVAEAGIAQGFSDGTYRPAANVTRQSMAAFLERGVGRAVSTVGYSVAVIPGDTRELASVTLDTGATGSGTTGFVVVTGTVWGSSNVSSLAGCPCTVEVILQDGETYLTRTRLQVPRLADFDDALDTATVQIVVPVQGDSVHRFGLFSKGLYSFGADHVFASGTIVASYFPLSGDGDSTATYDFTCPKNDGWEPNDTFATASRFFFTGNTRAIVCSGDLDVYEDQVPEGSTIDVSATFTNADGNIDLCLYRDQILVECSQGSGNFETINYASAPAGTYQIEVQLASDLGSVPGNTYTLTANRL
jgi:hypothetical protein